MPGTSHAARRAALRAITTARNQITPRADANRITVRLLISRLAAALGLPPVTWPGLTGAAGTTAITCARDCLTGIDMTGWDINDIGAAYEHLLTPDGRQAEGTWYTPPEVAAAMVRLSIGPQLDRLASGRDPGSVLQVLAVDPACGAGVFLVQAARFIAIRYSQRLTGSADP